MKRGVRRSAGVALSRLAALGAVAGTLLVPGSAAASTQPTALRVAPGTYLAAGPSQPGDAASSRAAIRPLPRIIGGSPISIAQAPWQVALEIAPGFASGNADDRQIRGGSLVAPDLVVTAAHCVADNKGRFTSSPARFSVVSGRTKLSSSAGQETQVADYHYFVDGADRPLYDPRRGAWDVALLQLSGPAPGTPIELAGPREAEAWSVGRAATISGWGSTGRYGKGPYPNGLRAVEIAIQPDAGCAAAYGRGFSRSTTFCAGTALGKRNACDGDSGGPVVVPLAGGGARLIGATSYVAGDCRTFVPSGYARLAADPIRSSLREAALALSGTDIVGSGGQAPTTMTPEQAEENAWIYVRADCGGWRLCRGYSARRCAGGRSGYRCKVTEFAKRRRVKFRCSRRVSVSAASGKIKRRGIGRWKCRRGW